MEIIGIIIGVALGALLAWLWLKNRITEAGNAGKDELNQLQLNFSITNSRKEQLEKELEEIKEKLLSEQGRYGDQSRELVKVQTEFVNLQTKLEEQKKEVAELQEQFSLRFKNLANEIFEEKSRKFTDQNKQNLHELLSPLKDRIIEFQKKVEDTNKESIQRNSSLQQQIYSLSELNKQITREAENLTKALKGDNKVQGNWGEVILERILEKSGLVKGQEYHTQVSETNEEGRRFQPDVVVKLPDNKNIIIDSKVSLISYERFSNCDEDLERASHLKTHINSIRLHLKGLSEKNYQNLYGVEGLDFVLLFIPVEPAFTLAVQHDTELFNDAYSRNIVIVSPSTLIATLRTIASIWKQEYQNKNALEIARQGGDLYDKFVAFTEDLKNIGKHLENSQKSYKESMKKLYEGNGNLVRRAERIRELGAKTSKQMDPKLLDRSAED